ncbi:alpha-L-fucosidase [bacterium]|nr:alpha-L-fucosidase [bacterium]
MNARGKGHFRDRILPAPTGGGFQMEDYWVWGASVIQGEDGRYHMFASRWPRALPFTPHWLTNSEIVRAVSDTPEGPYTFQEVVLPPRGKEFWDGKMTHNPVIRKVDNTYLLFYTGTTYQGDMPTSENPTTRNSALKLDAHRHERIGLATSKSVFGPWKRRDKPILDTRPGTWEQYLVSNASPFVLEDGRIMLYYKGVRELKDHAIGVAVADHYEGPYRRLFDHPFPIGIGAEDPTIWFEDGQYHALMLDCGRIYSPKEIFYAVSYDGLHWKASPNPVAISKVILWEDGEIRRMLSTERPQILVENGRATHVFFATSSKPGGIRKTWNMVVPLKPWKDVRDPLAWWKEARFGLFIHWGLYAIPAGIWKEKPVTHPSYLNPYCEHIMWLNRIPVAEYEKLAEQFNPTAFDADRIVQLAKDAGMKYIVVTAKHHDGFAMYHSRVSPYNIVDATPYQRDPLKDLAESCAVQGLRLGFYYSLGRDWHHPEAVSGRTNDWDFTNPEERDYQKYLDEKVKPQLEELLTGYGPVSILWFDSPESTTVRQSIDLEMFVKRLQPECIVNNRIGNDVGDYVEARDNAIFKKGQCLPWESPGTMAESWGYSRLDTEAYWKSPKTLIRRLVDIASQGGNYLLNIGPDAEGNLPQMAVDRLQGFADWMSVYSESVYGTSGSRFKTEDWGRYTIRENVVYAHIFDWPENGYLPVRVPGEEIDRAILLTDQGESVLKFKPTYGSGAIISVPQRAPSQWVSVIKIIMK